MKTTSHMLAVYVCFLCLATNAIASDFPVADAAERADWEQLSVLLANNGDATLPQTDGMTALHWAAWHDNVEAAALLARAHVRCCWRSKMVTLNLPLTC